MMTTKAMFRRRNDISLVIDLVVQSHLVNIRRVVPIVRKDPIWVVIELLFDITQPMSIW